MTKVTLTILALAALAACEAPMTGPTDPMAEEFDGPAEGTDTPGAQGPNADAWWAL